MKTKLSLLILTSFLFLSFISIKTSDDDKLKNKLIGTWSGSEEDNQQHGLTKYWIKTHNKNGTFIILFTSVENCEVESHIEKGKWKVKDGLLYETFDSDGKTDIYEIEMLDDDNVKFKAKELSLEFDNKEYEFVETRQE
jgi:hypothetical protein